MVGMGLLGLTLVLGVLVGAVMGCLAFFQIKSLLSRVDELELQMMVLEHASAETLKNSAYAALPQDQPPVQQRPAEPSRPAPPNKQAEASVTSPIAARTFANVPPKPADAPRPVSATAPIPPNPRQSRPAPAPAESVLQQKLIASVKTHWMVWLGGICIGFAGIFLAKHSVEQGLLGPGARIALSIITALVFHGAAEYLRRVKGESDVFSALAGGASIMLYAALLAALHLYQLLSPGLTFPLLIVVSLATMLLALRHGPVLAAIGILGAFSVPILVNTGSNNIIGALIYSFIITVSALLLIRYVFQPWLWIGTLVGAIGWWLIGFASAKDIPLVLNAYLICLAYVAIAISRWDWLLGKAEPVSEGEHFLAVFQNLDDQQGRLAVLCVLIAALFSLNIALDTMGYHWLIIAPSLPLLCFWVARRNPALSILPGIVLIGLLAALLLQGLSTTETGVEGFDRQQGHQPLLWLLIQLSGVFALLSLWLLRVSAHTGIWATLAFLSPVLFIAVGYLRIEAFSTDWRWSLGTATLGALYMHLAFRQKSRVGTMENAHTPMVIVSLTLASHLACSLALVMLLREATLTLALSLQVISLTWLYRQFSYKPLEKAAKILLLIVLARLSLNPWLLTYPTDVHWSLWTYGGALACCVVASRIAMRGQFKEWLVGASMHLFVLLLLFEVRYWLYNGQVFASTYGFTEAAINTCTWGALGLVYFWRAQFSQELFRLYRLASNVLLIMAIANFVGITLLLQNPLFGGMSGSATSALAPLLQHPLFRETFVSATPVFNILLLAYGAPVLLFTAAYWLLEPPYKRIAGTCAALALLLFCSLEIRHLWQGTLSLGSGTSDGELYTYSIVWLALAVVGSICAIRFAHRSLYKGSMLLLIVVIAKIFLIDMNGLTGLLRAASFMGLGLTLLGLAYLHQQLQLANANAEDAQ